jgi:hypothetical protein
MPLFMVMNGADVNTESGKVPTPEQVLTTLSNPMMFQSNRD